MLPITAPFRHLFKLAQSEQTRFLDALLWRMVLVEEMVDSRKARDSLERHLEYSAGRHYQMAHNRWCNALHCILGHVQNKHSRIPYLNIAEGFLEEATHLYSAETNFPFYAKCLASILLLYAWITQLKDHPQQAVTLLIGASFLFRINGVQPQHEAMSEIVPLVQAHFPQITSVFAEDFIPELLNGTGYSSRIFESFERVQSVTLGSVPKGNRVDAESIFRLTREMSHV